jgi:hemolysin D
MNETTRPSLPARSADQRPARISGRDREFLPAALEILETPAAPGKVALMLALCALFAAALCWSVLGHLDVHAVASGKIVTAGYSKTIQAFDHAKVTALNVKNGTRVQAGDVLVEFDRADATTDVKTYTEAMNAAAAEIDRRAAAIAAAKAFPAQPLLPAKKLTVSNKVDASITAREQAILSADLQQLADQLSNLDLQIGQKVATRQRLNMSIAFQTELIETLQNRVNMRNESLRLSVGTKVNLFDALESLDKSRSALASDKGQLIETDAAVNELASRKTRALSDFIAENTSKLADAERRRLESSQQLSKAQIKLERTSLVAPIDGTVQQLSITTLGQVVSPAQQLMVVVPTSGVLHVEAFVSNMDIGFVKVGQEATIKVDAFPFTRYGTIKATVTEIAREAIDEQEAKRREANVASASSSVSSPSPNQQQSFVFPITLTLAAQSLSIEGNAFPLAPGMTVTAEIRTESRRAIDYFLSPLRRTVSQSLHER